MSIVYKALQQAEMENPRPPVLDGSAPFNPAMFDGAQDVAQDVVQNVPPDENSWRDHAPLLRPIAIEENRIVMICDRDSLGAEKFRVLRARLRHLQDRGNLKKVVITSGASAEGKTTVAANLAISLACHTSQRVLLLEGDLRHPALASKLGLGDLRGLREWFEDREPITKFIYRVEGHQLWFLPAGHPAEDALRILQSERFMEVVNRVSECFEWIIIDAPPLQPLADIHLLVKKSDGVLVVIRDGVTEKEQLAKGLEGLDGAKLIGVVRNDAPTASQGSYQKYYAAPAEAGGRNNGGNKQKVRSNPGALS
jgi:capsular exopolysaccharide synthesis family protein